MNDLNCDPDVISAILCRCKSSLNIANNLLGKLRAIVNDEENIDCEFHLARFFSQTLPLGSHRGNLRKYMKELMEQRIAVSDIVQRGCMGITPEQLGYGVDEDGNVQLLSEITVRKMAFKQICLVVAREKQNTAINKIFSSEKCKKALKLTTTHELENLWNESVRELEAQKLDNINSETADDTEQHVSDNITDFKAISSPSCYHARSPNKNNHQQVKRPFDTSEPVKRLDDTDPGKPVKIKQVSSFNRQMAIIMKEIKQRKKNTTLKDVFIRLLNDWYKHKEALSIGNFKKSDDNSLLIPLELENPKAVFPIIKPEVKNSQNKDAMGTGIGEWLAFRVFLGPKVNPENLRKHCKNYETIYGKFVDNYQESTITAKLPAPPQTASRKNQ